MTGTDPLDIPTSQEVNPVVAAMAAPPGVNIAVTPGVPIAAFPELLGPIDSSINFNAIPVQSAGAFRFWQVESLLDQASDLLDRGERDEAIYNDLQAKWVALKLETIEFDKLNAIHANETTAGWYTVNPAQSAYEQNAQQHEHTGTQEITNAYSDLLANEEEFNQRRLSYIERAGLIAKASALADYTKEHYTDNGDSVLYIQANAEPVNTGLPSQPPCRKKQTKCPTGLRLRRVTIGSASGVCTKVSSIN